MIKSVIVTNHLGESLEMVLANPYETGFAITSIKGLGPSKSSINTTDIATSDGSVFNSARVNKRNIVLSITFVGNESIETLRQKTYKYFPVKKRLTLEFITDNRFLGIVGYVESNEPNIFSSAESCQISIICPDPNFYSSGDDGTVITEFNSFTSLFEFPWAEFYDMEQLPHGFENYIYHDEYLDKDLYTLEFGSIDTIGMHNIPYDGDTETGVLIIMHAIGPVTMPVVYDITTQESITVNTNTLEVLTGSPMIASDTIEISTVKGNKYVKLIRSGHEYNIINCVGKHAGWFQLLKGDNVFGYSAESGIENLILTMENRMLYEGV